MTVAKAFYRRPLTALTVLLVGGCLGHTELVSAPHEPVTRVTLRFRADSEDAVTAVALRWGTGFPRVAVTITSGDTTQSPRVLQASDSGTLLLAQLAGHYGIRAERWLTDSERAHLPPGDDAVGFISRTALNSATATEQMTVDGGRSASRDRDQ
jgi:hypothetical protein